VAAARSDRVLGFGTRLRRLRFKAHRLASGKMGKTRTRRFVRLDAAVCGGLVSFVWALKHLVDPD